MIKLSGNKNDFTLFSGLLTRREKWFSIITIFVVPKAGIVSVMFFVSVS